MHDLGRLALLVAYPAEYEATIRNCAERCLDLLDFERERFGLHHAEAGTLLSQRWGLPEEFHIVLGRHHDSHDDGSELSLLRIVHVACRLADAFEYYVTKPLLELSLEQIVSDLPEAAARAILSNADELRNRIDTTIQNFDNAADDPQPYLPQLAARSRLLRKPIRIRLPAIRLQPNRSDRAPSLPRRVSGFFARCSRAFGFH